MRGFHQIPAYVMKLLLISKSQQIVAFPLILRSLQIFRGKSSSIAKTCIFPHFVGLISKDLEGSISLQVL